MEFLVLGPLEVRDGASPLPPGGAKQRALLAILLLHHGQVVATDALVDALWGERPPETAPTALHGLVSSLRKLLGPELIVTQPPGYLVRLGSHRLDLDWFEALARTGLRALEEGDASKAAASLGAALELWRGPPLGDVRDSPLVEPEIRRLEELRSVVLEGRIEADLTLGRAAELVGELGLLVAREPFRERLRGQLMVALYRSGRQTQALEVYREGRATLVAEIGIEPSAGLQELHRAMLRQDPSLIGESRNGPGTSAAHELPAPAGPASRPSARLMAGTIGAIAVTAAGVAAIAFTAGVHRRPVRLSADAVGLIQHGRLAHARGLDSAPAALTAGDDAIWVANAEKQSVSRLEPGNLEIRQTISVGSAPSALAVGRGAVWVANGLDGTVSRIDPKTNKVVQTIGVGNGPAAVAYGLGSVWVANRSDQTVSRIDPSTGEVLGTLPAGADAAAIAAGEGAVWVADDARGRVVRLDPDGREPAAPINVGNGPSAVALGAGSVWIANALDSTVSRVDPRSDAVIATVRVGAGPNGLAATRDGIWVSNQRDRTLSRIDPRTNRVDRTLRLGQRPEAMAASNAGILVAAGPSAASHRGGTLRLAASLVPGGSVDPIDYGPFTSAAILTNDGLTGFRRVGGVEGTELVPDLATSLPAPSEGGRSYTFRVRRGIRYSDGRLVRPEDFRRALERTFVVTRDPVYYGAIAGAAECAAEPRHCDLSRGIAVDHGAWTITFHLRAPDPDFLFKLALPFAYAVPAGTPNRDVRTRPVAATGPYMIAAYRPGSFVRLVRNPRFHVWSDAAQPAGYPDEIVWRLGVRPAGQVAAVEAGRTDVAFDGVPPSRLAQVETQYASQVRQYPVARTTFAFLNTRVRPFSDERARRAVSYAADREAFVQAVGGPDRAQPTCQILPPNFPGYRPYCPYTIRPGPAGVWSAPGLARARRLIAASGTRGAKVTVWIPANRRPEGGVFVTLLQQLGYRARAKHLDDDSYYAGIGDPGRRIQAGLVSWQPDFPAASNFIAFFFKCPVGASGANTNPSQFCDRGIDGRIERALELEATDPAIATSMWSRLDREVVDRAAMVPLLNPKQVDFVSRRVGNYQYNPQWGVLLDQLWVR
jgi:peptide/nickel transport system substrate-binding protein